MEKFIPIGNNVLIREIYVDTEKKTDSGIVTKLATGSQASKKGLVIAVGLGNIHPATGERIPLAVKEGDVVFYSPYAGNQFEVNKEELMLIDEPSIYGIIKEE